jgi:glycerate-2-kinase
MENKITNRQTVCISKERDFLLKILKAGLDAVDIEKNLKQKISIIDHQLKAEGKIWDLNNYKNIYLLEIGTNAQYLSSDVKKIFSDKSLSLNSKISTSTNPYELSEKTSSDDLVICLTSGHIKDILELEPQKNTAQDFYLNAIKENIPEDKQTLLFKHIFQLAGGGLAKLLYPAHLLALDLDIYTDSLTKLGLVSMNSTTMYQAKEIIIKYNLGIGKIHETPKEQKYFENVSNVNLVSTKTFFDVIKTYVQDYSENCKVIFSNKFSEDEINKVKPNEIIIYKNLQETDLTLILDNLQEKDTFLYLDEEGKGFVLDAGTKNRLMHFGMDLQSNSELNKNLEHSGSELFSLNKDYQVTPKLLLFYRA